MSDLRKKIQMFIQSKQHKKVVYLIFDKNWKFQSVEITNREKRILQKGIRFKYDAKTTIRELFLYLNILFGKSNKRNRAELYKEIDNENNLKFLYRMVHKKQLIYFFDLDMSIEWLINYFGSNIFFMHLVAFTGIGAGAFCEKDMTFYFHSREKGKHHLPHIHVKYKDYEATIEIVTGKTRGEFPSKKLKEAVDIVLNNTESLLIKWNTLTDGYEYKFNNNELYRVI